MRKGYPPFRTIFLHIPTFGLCKSGSPELNTPKVMLQLEEYDPENYYESKGPTEKNIKGKACSPAIEPFPQKYICGKRARFIDGELIFTYKLAKKIVHGPADVV